ncbi:uncharacterized protein [Pleurodeles waltl]|uniref:uncharacterized protein isoform X2 n=1 Tax=Pleurodeles waltl TaxID=8319 RepID=UPI00370961A2
MWRMQDTQNNEKVPNPPEPLRATLAAFPSQNFSAARPRPEEVHQPGGAKNLGSQRCAWTLRKEVGKLPIPDALLLGSCQETFLRNTLEKNVNHCNTILCRTGAAPNTASEAHSDDKPETHMGHPPSVLVLAMLERLEAKLDHLQNSMEDVPSRVANLMERIWVEKGGVFLENGAGSLEAVSPAGIRDFTFTRSSPTSHPASPGDPSRSLQAVFSDNHEPVRGPGTQLMFSSEHELDEHLKQEPLSVGSWDPQVSHFMKPQSPEVHGPQKDQHRKLVLQTRLARQKDLSIQPGLPGGRDLNMLPVSPAGQDLQRDPCKEPVFPEGPGPQQHQSLQLVFPGGKDPGKHLKPEALSLGGSEWNQRQKTVRPGEQEADGPLQPEPWSGGGPQRNQCQQPVRPDAQEDGYKPAPPCINAQSPSVPTSCLRWDTLSAGGAALTDTLEGGSVTSDISPAIPGYGTMTNIISVVIKEEEEDIHPATYQGSEETQTTTHPTALQSEEGRVNGGETSTSTERKTFTHSFILNQEHDLQTPERRLTCSEWEKVYRTKIFLEGTPETRQRDKDTSPAQTVKNALL